MSQKCALFVQTLTAMGVDGLNAFDLFPKKFERHDHVVVVTMNPSISVEAFEPYAEQFAACFTPLVDVVIVDTDGIAGELRQPVHRTLFVAPTAIQSAERVFRPVERAIADKALRDRLRQLLPSSPTFTLHIENGVKYTFDAMRVMFCSGNTTERMHFGGSVLCPDETVVDMFAGIGYFTLPLAMHGGLRHLFALEKNHDSVQYLTANVALNNVQSKVTIIQGDNRADTPDTTPLIGACDRVLMGYIPCCAPFLPRAVQFLKVRPNGSPHGIVHYHCLAENAAHAESVVHQDMQSQLPHLPAGSFAILQKRSVKSYSPKRFHFVVDIQF